MSRRVLICAAQADRPLDTIDQSRLGQPTYLYAVQSRFGSPGLGELLQTIEDRVAAISSVFQVKLTGEDKLKLAETSIA